MYTVYMHTAPNGKRYVGITSKNPEKRWRNGNGYWNNTHFYREIQKVGWLNIRHEIVSDGLAKSQACAMEIRLIAEYDTTNPDKGYNHSTGGESGHAGVPLSVEARRKLSEAHKGKHMSAEARRKISESEKGANNPWYGKHHSAETRRKISEAKTGANHQNYGKHLSIETRRKISEALKGHAVSADARRKTREANSKSVVCVDTGKQYASLTEAATATGVKPCTVSDALHGRCKTAGGYHWKYVENEENGESK